MEFLKSKKRKVLFSALAFFLFVFLFLRFSPYAGLRRFKTQGYSKEYIDRNGVVLYVSSLSNGLHRQFAPIQEIPETVQDAFILSEDKKFFRHMGVDVFSILRAFFQNVSEKRRVSGASTITMQLARIISPSEKRTLGAKMVEAFNALRLEARFSKRKILELYLNNLPFGNNVEGVVSAARLYFGKNLSELTAEEVAILSVIPRRPSDYNPIANPELCANIAGDLYEGSGEKLLACAKSSMRHAWPFSMPHYIHFIQENNLSGNFPSTNNRIQLSADSNLQKLIEQKIGEALERGNSSRIENAAAVVIENKSGKILAWVGSQDWFDNSASGQIDGVLVKNQMGSSMKPFLYALALENGFRPNSVFPDVPTEFLVEIQGEANSYRPENFNNRFNGPVLFRKSLASSLNIPAVYILNEIGIDKYLSCLFKLGFKSLENGGEKAGLGLSLGAGEVTLLELSHAFSVFANDGILVPLEFEKKSVGERVYGENSVRLICDILSDKKARVTGFGYNQTYETDYPSIFKTGTANQYQNIVALGSTVDFTVGVWMGNFSGNTVVGKTGSSFPAKIAKETLDFLNGEKKDEFKKPSLKKEKICALSGMRAGKYCPSSIFEYVVEDDFGGSEPCSWHKLDENARLVTEFPAVYQKWLSDDFYNSSINYKSSGLKIVSPKSGSTFYLSSFSKGLQQIACEIIGGRADSNEISVFYDGKEFRFSRPFHFFLPVERGRHILKAVFGDESDCVEFEVM